VFLIIVQILMLAAWYLLPAAAVLPAWLIFLPLIFLAVVYGVIGLTLLIGAGIALRDL
jgi:hypothetical protein